MQNEVGEAIQLIYLTSQMLAVGSSLVLKTPGKIIQGGKVLAEKTSWMQLQFKLLCNFKSKGSYETLSLKDMDRITGGDYRLVRIPIEKGMKGFEEEAIRFFDALKTLKIPFSEMPDINIGDGYMEIAINPQDSPKLKNLMEEYNFPTGSAETISMEEYLGNAEKKSFQAFQNQAVNQAKELLETQKKTDDAKYPITADEVLWKQEPVVSKKGDREGVYYVRIPGRSYRNRRYMRFQKSEVEILNNGKTIFTTLDPEATYPLYNQEGELAGEEVGESIIHSWDKLQKRGRTPHNQEIARFPKQREKTVEIISSEQFAEYFSKRDFETPKRNDQEQPLVISPEKQSEIETVSDTSISSRNEEQNRKPATMFSITTENMAHVWNDRLYLTFPGFPDGDTVCIDQTEVEMKGKDFFVMIHPDRKYTIRKLDETGHVRPEKSYKTGAELCTIIRKSANVQKKTKAVIR